APADPPGAPGPQSRHLQLRAPQDRLGPRGGGAPLPPLQPRLRRGHVLRGRQLERPPGNPGGVDHPPRRRRPPRSAAGGAGGVPRGAAGDRRAGGDDRHLPPAASHHHRAPGSGQPLPLLLASGVPPMTGDEMLSTWAAEQLEAGGWVRRMHAEGERLRALHGPDSVADLALGQPLGEPVEAVRTALRAAAAERGARRFGYMPNLGFPEARERVAADAGSDVGPDCVALTGGAGAAICLALRTFVDPGDEVIGVVPYFGEYRAYCASVGAVWVTAASAP